jgi:hypothetical protein
MRAFRLGKLVAIAAAALGGLCFLSEIAPAPAEAFAGSGRFNILWGINTQIEPLADPTATDKVQIRQLQSLVDGYSLNVLPGGPLSYWPGRPYYCAIRKRAPRANESNIVIDNVTHSVANLRPQCEQMYQQYLNSLHSRDAQQPYYDAVGRMIRNLSLASEHEAGRIVDIQTIVSTRNFLYSPGSDTVAIKTLPAIDLLAKNGVIPDSLFIYQEKAHPEGMLQVPAAPGGATEYLPDNTRMVGMIANALRAYRHPVRELQVNVRIWRPGVSPSMVSALNAAAGGYSVGINFEVGPMGLDEPLRNGQTRVDNLAGGIAWILGNTNNPVSVLIPAYWRCGDTCTETNTDETRAVLISYLDDFITRLNRDIRADGASSGICTGKLSLTTGGYGTPIHPLILPTYTRTGKLAGTVGGEIIELHNLRTRLCG